MSRLLDVSRFVGDPVMGREHRRGRVMRNYRSVRFGVVDMCVETVEPDPIQESPIYLENRRVRLLAQAQTRLLDAIFS